MNTPVSQPPFPIKTLLDIAKEWDQPWLPLLSFSTMPVIEKYAISMPRDPNPTTGQSFSASFKETLVFAHKINQAVHDGIVALVRNEQSEEYYVAGWSLWFVPTERPVIAPFLVNRGTAFHICSALSTTNEFDLLCRLEHGKVIAFEQGVCREYFSGER